MIMCNIFLSYQIVKDVFMWVFIVTLLRNTLHNIVKSSQRECSLKGMFAFDKHGRLQIITQGHPYTSNQKPLQIIIE